MITEKNANFVETQIRRPLQLQQLLPWFLAAGAAVLYLATLNRWVTMSSLAEVARTSGWTWEPELSNPLYWVLTYPLRWLPERAVPIALNLFSTLCAVLTLALLARSVILLPHDRTQAQRLREKSEFSLLSIRHAWLPPVLAVLICGLQLTFWEHATVGSNVMLDLLVFAYIIRCLLEFRIDERQSWLTRAAVVYGLGMTNHWALLGYFPLFIAALIWIKGLAFFNLRFLGQMALCGVLGVTLYLLLPLVQSLSDFAPVPFWKGLTSNVGSQKGMLTLLYQNGRQVIALLALTSLVPLLLISIRWAASFGDTSQIGIALASLMFHVVHGLLFVACIWVALDPLSSPRHKGYGLPFLSFYYLGALSVGYFCGYFLLVFGSRAERTRYVPPLMRSINQAVVAGTWLLALIAPAILVYRNLPQIRTSNGPMLWEYTGGVAKALPASKVILFSDDPGKLLLLRSFLTQSRKAEGNLFVQTSSLQWPGYHKFLKRIHGDLWPTEPPKDFKGKVEDLTLLQLAVVLSRSNSLYYLHPSFGYYFEQFYLRPQGLLYKLEPMPAGALLKPPLAEGIVAENEAFWAGEQKSLETTRRAVAEASADRAPDMVEKLLRRLYLRGQINREVNLVAAFYSSALNYWAVELQKLGRLSEARRWFELAKTLNSDNVVVNYNLECNRRLEKGEKHPAFTKNFQDTFGKHRNWQDVMRENGPYDEPSFCYELGRIYAASGLHRQAAQQFARVRDLAPENLPARLWLAQLHVMARKPEEAVRLIDQIHRDSNSVEINRTNRADLLFVEMSAHLGMTNIDGAAAAVQSMLDRFPNDREVLNTATHVFIQNGRYSNALALVDQQLKISTNDATIWVNKGYALMQLREYEQAVAPLTRALELDTNNHSALLNLAITSLLGNKLDEAQRHYEALQKLYPTAFQVYYGLGEIAYRKKDTNSAIRNYQLYLTNAPAGFDEVNTVVARLKELTPGGN